MSYQDAKNTADKLRKETEEVKEKKELARKEAMAEIAVPKGMEKLYSENAELGIENLFGESLPYLNIYKAGKSEAKLANGEKPTDGYFVYSETGEQFKTVVCHLLALSKGFRVQNQDNPAKTDYKQILAGVMEGDEMKPFIFYMNGRRARTFWDFAGETINKFTHAKPTPVPMFALTVVIDTKEVDVVTQAGVKKGTTWIPVWKLITSDEGYPIVIQDEGKFVYLRDHVKIMQDAMEKLSNKGVDASGSSEYDNVPHPADAVEAGEVFNQ